jgi:hypothetical protein
MGLCGQTYARVHFIPQLGTLDLASGAHILQAEIIDYNDDLLPLSTSLKFFIPKLCATKK